ncbi:hypothetical protein DMB44_03540 [Thermoplasma sp. Kam2015]|uniref:RidA family protein n=1 Tax=Thermoplasma sp. Kam2015 TaxID=2094122 RepID=UPI000D855317|nr:RidA family protein [Thermoplasma sp. Kam2015]PYB68426.1 hypothetical protein DMB44_03540 [Thermoplasma sp. Kam2015]
MSQKKVIDVSDLPKGGPYSHAVVSGNLVFVSGQTGQVPDKKTGFSDQFNIAMEKIRKILQQAGSSLDNILKTTVYIADARYFKELNDLYGKFFKSSPPARTTIVSGFVADDVLVEIDVIASI